MPDTERHKTWNDRYESRPGTSLQLEPFLIDHVSMLKPGSVLDMACGEGRNSVFLSEKGFKVAAIDFSEIALGRLRKYSNEKNLNIETLELDLSKDDSLKRLKRFDNIIVVHFKLKDGLLDLIPSILNRGGVFLYCTYNHRQLEIRTFPEEFCLKKGELVDKKWPLELLRYTSFKDTRGYHDGYVFKK